MSAPEQPNIVFVFSDQHRGQAMGCAGNDDVRTPNFDRFAGAGTRFERAYANSPVCGPSRACLLSGQYAVHNQVIHNDLPLPTDVITVADVLSEAGYHTGYVGKWHLDGVPRDKFTPPGPRRQGFDDFWAVYNCAHDYFNGKYYRDTPDIQEIDGYEPAGQTELAMEFIEGAEEPFCLFLSWGPPHDPYELVPEEYREQYDPANLTLRPNARPLFGHGASDSAPPIRHWGTAEAFDTGEPYDYDDPREVLADYYAAVTALDDQFGRLLSFLDDRGLADDTVVSYTSDHGDMLYSHGENGKSSIYEEAANVPFVVRWPGEIGAGEVEETPFSTVDMAPTLLGLADVEVPVGMDGTDFAERLVADEDPPQDAVFVMSVSGTYRGVRTERYTYARLPDTEEYRHVPGGRWRLFDNEEDPYQFRNRVYDEAYAGVVEELDDRLDAWLAENNDPFLSKEGHVRDLGLEAEWNAMVDWFRDVHEGYSGPSKIEPR